MKIKIFGIQFLLLILVVINFGCFKKNVATTLDLNQQKCEQKEITESASDITDESVKRDNGADNIDVENLSVGQEESPVVTASEIMPLTNNPSETSIKEDTGSKDMANSEISNNCNENKNEASYKSEELITTESSEQASTINSSDIKNSKEEEKKEKIKVLMEYYNRALSLYDAGEEEKAREELKQSIRIIVELDLDTETLFRFGDLYKDVFENGSAQEAAKQENVSADTSGISDNIITEEKKIMESLDKTLGFDIPVEFNKEVETYIKRYTTDCRERMARRLARSSKYIERLKDVFKEEGVPQDLAYLPMIESEFKVRAYSRAGAAGMWQFMKQTGRRYKLVVDWSIDERFDPIVSARASARYLKDLYKIFDSWLLAEAAYNAGEFRILRAMGVGVSRDFWYLAQQKLLPRETRSYVADFMANLIIAKNPEKYGFTDIKYEVPLEYNEVILDYSIDLGTAAKLAECSVEELKSLNPALLKWCTPVGYPKYHLKVPNGKGEAFNTNMASLKGKGKINGMAQHTVKEGETMSSISWKYGVPIDVIAKTNNIKNVNNIIVGTNLLIPYGDNSTQKMEVATRENGSNYKKIIYVVQKGDTLWDIAKKYNISVGKLIEWNETFFNRTQIYPGEQVALWVEEEL